MVGIKMKPIAKRQLHSRFATRADDLIRLSHRHRKRFFTDHMFSRPSGPHTMLGVEGVGSDDVDDIDVRIIRQTVHLIVAVDCGVRESVVVRPRLPLARGASDHSS